MSGGAKADSVSRPSLCLEQEENELVFSLIGRRCTVRYSNACEICFGAIDLHHNRHKLDVFSHVYATRNSCFEMVCFQSLATSVAQLYIASPESRNKWSKKTTGVVCFVKDNAKRSYFIRIYSIVVSNFAHPIPHTC